MAKTPTGYFGELIKAQGEGLRDRFRRTMDALSEFAKRVVKPEEFSKDASTALRRFLHGKAWKDHAAALKQYAESEKVLIDIDFDKATLPDRIAQMKAKTRRDEAEATLAELQARSTSLELVARYRLVERLTELRVVVTDAADTSIVLAGVSKVDFWRLIGELFTDEELELLLRMGVLPEEFKDQPAKPK
jgi:uncharacterized protein YqfA (UPF0365 family)